MPSRRSIRDLADRLRRRAPGAATPSPAVDPERNAVLHRVRLLVEEARYDDAQHVLDDALETWPGDTQLLATIARLDGRRGDWAGAAARWDRLITTTADTLSPRDWTTAANVQRRLRDIDGAAATIAQGLERFPSRLAPLWEGGHIAMAHGDWDDAVIRWSRYWRIQSRKEGFEMRELPVRSNLADWYEAGWQDVAAHLDSAQAGTTQDIGPEFHLALARVLTKAGLHDDRLAVLERGARVHPDDRELAHSLASARLARGGGEALPITPEEVVAVLDALPAYSPPAGGGLGPVRLLRVPEHSSVDLALRTTLHVDQHNLGALVQDLSERDRWPEPLALTNELLAAARERADSFAARHASPPHLPAETLSDALVIALYQESALVIPMIRLAAELAQRAGEAPVVISVPEPTGVYLGGYNEGHFDLVVLYFALLDLGANAFLCVTEAQAPGEDTTTFRFLPGWRAITPQIALTEDPAPHRRALVPAGIRRAGQLAARLDDLVVYQSGSVIKDFAYDRSLKQDFSIVANARLHPEEQLLPTFSFALDRVGRIAGHDLAGSDRAPTYAAIEVGEPVGGTWEDWLARAALPLLEHLALTASADVERRGVTEAHIGDHLYVESVIVGDAVKRAGGRVVVWPHSTNPVHVGLRRPDSFDQVHAVTRTGAEIWRAAFPDKDVVHAPDSMLTMSPPRDFDPELPLSLVIFGGRSTLGDMPVMDTAAHREQYRRFFDALGELRTTAAVNVFFKPRGYTGEHEQWLFQTVGKRADWKPVYEHPLRLELPNMVFASTSMGTSALIEGIARGIPGFIVREFPVRDYTTLSEDSFPILSVDGAIELLQKATTAEGYRALIDEEQRGHRDEIGL